MEQLQAKELELLQLKTEMETSQGPDQTSDLLLFYISLYLLQEFLRLLRHTLYILAKTYAELFIFTKCNCRHFVYSFKLCCFHCV